MIQGTDFDLEQERLVGQFSVTFQLQNVFQKAAMCEIALHLYLYILHIEDVLDLSKRISS